MRMSDTTYMIPSIDRNHWTKSSVHFSKMRNRNELLNLIKSLSVKSKVSIVLNVRSWNFHPLRLETMHGYPLLHSDLAFKWMF